MRPGVRSMMATTLDRLLRPEQAARNAEHAASAAAATVRHRETVDREVAAIRGDRDVRRS